MGLLLLILVRASMPSYPIDSPPHISPPIAAMREGRRLYQESVLYFDVGSYYEAIVDLEKAFTLTGADELLFNLALCHAQLDNVFVARRYLQLYLKGDKKRQKEAQVVRLSSELLQKIDEEYDALGLYFVYDPHTHYLGWMRRSIPTMVGGTP